jgi:hypothetical protein
MSAGGQPWVGAPITMVVAPIGVGILGDQPPGGAVIGGMRQNLAFGRDVMCGDLLGLDSFCFPQQAVSRGQERDPHRDHGRAGEEGNVDVISMATAVTTR